MLTDLTLLKFLKGTLLLNCQRTFPDVKEWVSVRRVRSLKANELATVPAIARLKNNLKESNLLNKYNCTSPGRIVALLNIKYLAV